MYRRIRDLREDRDLSQAYMAKVLHCSQQVYSNYELGRREAPVDVLIRLADFHKTSVDYLLGRTDDPRPYPPGGGCRLPQTLCSSDCTGTRGRARQKPLKKLKI